MTIRRTAKQRIARYLTAPLVGRIARSVFRERVPGSGSITETSGIDDRTVAALLFGFYESAERRFVRRYLPRDVDVVELGGSLGVVTQTIRQHLRRDRRIVTVEADARLVRRLATTLSGTVDVVHAAIDYAGEGATTQFSRGEDNVSGHLGAGSDVPRRTLSQVAVAYGLDRFTLVCDIEGAEAGMVMEDADVLRRCPRIIVETHATTFRGRHFTSEDLRLRFEALGFRTLARHGPVFAFAGRGAGP